MNVVQVGLAGSLGAAARYLLDGWITGRSRTVAPVATTVINVAGSLLLGLFTGLVEFHHVGDHLTVVGGSGFCGGFTTFSTASVETVLLLIDGHRGTAAWSVGVTVGASLLAAVLGLWIASL